MRLMRALAQPLGGDVFHARDSDADDPVLTVVTGTGPSYRRADGVKVVAIGALGP